MKSSAPIQSTILSLLFAVIWVNSAAAGVIVSPAQVPEISLSEASMALLDFPVDDDDPGPTLRADWPLAGMSSSQIAGQGSQLMSAIAILTTSETPVTVSFGVGPDRARLPAGIPISLLKVPIVFVA